MVFYYRKRLIITISLLLVAGFLITSLSTYYVSLLALRDQITQNELPITSNTIHSEFQKHLQKPQYIASTMAHNTFVLDWAAQQEPSADSMYRYLKKIQHTYNTVSSFYVSTESQRYYHSSEQNQYVRKENPVDQWYFNFIKRDVPFEVNINEDGMNNDVLTVFVNYKVFNTQGEFIGVTGVGVSIDNIEKLLIDFQQKYGQNIYVTDIQGNVKINSAPDRSYNKNIQQVITTNSSMDDLKKKVNQQLSYVRDGEQFHINIRHMPQFDWYLFVEQSEEVIVRELFETLVINLLIYFVIALIVLLSTNYVLNAYQRKLEKLAVTDKLTGLYNREAFDLLIQQKIAESRREKRPICLAIIDIDHFKTINDRFGHLVGDKVLQELSEHLRQSTRQADVLCRWGGEEFVLLLSGCDLAHGADVTEDLRLSIGELRVQTDDGQTITFTASAGIATLKEDDDITRLMKRADDALYQAKKAGRNQLILA